MNSDVLPSGDDDEGHFRTVENRGEAVASNLEDAVRMGEGRFKVIHANEAEVVVYHGPELREVAIVTANRHDAHAYDVRSERRVTSWAITFLQQLPKRLTNLHRGDALVLLFELVYRTGFDEPVNLGLAARQLPSAILGHLERLALAVPDDLTLHPTNILGRGCEPSPAIIEGSLLSCRRRWAVLSHQFIIPIPDLWVKLRTQTDV